MRAAATCPKIWKLSYVSKVPTSPTSPAHEQTVQPASLFERERQPVPEIHGLAQLDGNPALALPLAGRVVVVDFASTLGSLEGTATLRLRLIPNGESSLRVEFFFRGIKELRLPRLPAEGFDVANFTIEDARSSGWVGVNWLVGDATTDAFAFYAQEAEVIAVTREG